MWICGCDCSAKENRGGHQTLGAAATGNCESPDMGAGNETRVLWKTKSHLSSPKMFIFNDKQLELGDTARLAECLASRHEDLSSVPPNTV